MITVFNSLIDSGTENGIVVVLFAVIMFISYLKIAWRSLMRYRVYSVINVTGLAIGLAVVMLIGLWVWDELSYNTQFPNYDRIVRIRINQTHGNDTRTNSTVPIPLIRDMGTRYGNDFSRTALGSWSYNHVIAVGNKQLLMAGMYAEPGLTEILALRTIDGRKASLDDPSSMLITESMAKALYGDVPATGKTLVFDDSSILRIGGVIPDMPYSSDFQGVNYFVPWINFERMHPWVAGAVSNWSTNSFQGFGLLQPHADLTRIQAKVRGELNGHGRTDKPEVLLHPMSKWHLYDTFINGKNVGGSIEYVWMFGIIGGFVLLLACINFMNLSTARSEKRAREVGIRKSMGSQRSQLVGQFLGESLFLALVSLLVALVLVELSLPWFNGVADKQIHIFWNKLSFWIPALGLTLLTGLVAGSYPAFYLSSFNVVKVLKGGFKPGRGAAIPRQALLLLQLTVSVALIVGTIIVYQQIAYVKNRPVGYTREGLITVDIVNPAIMRHFAAMRRELIQSGAAVETAWSSSPTTQVYNNQSGIEWPGKDPNFTPSFAMIWGSMDFGKTVGWQFIAGRDFSRDFPSDSSGIVLNESAVKYMGLKNPIGTTLKDNYSNSANKNFHVIGVIRDMVMESPYAPVKQSVFMIDDSDRANVITVRINPGLSAAQALTTIGGIFRKYEPSEPFKYTFNDESYAQKFALEDRIGQLASFFTVLAIFISCLGLWGMIGFMAEQRVKEIGIRKVLGASILNLWALLSRDFLWLVGLSFFVALPLAYRVMSGWLRHYPYRVTISAWVFVATVVLALLITLATVSWQAVRAARANPVKSLRAD